MFILPDDFDVDDFRGKFLSEVGLGIGTISLNFDSAGGPGSSKPAHVTMHAMFEFAFDGGVKAGYASDPITAAGLSRFLNQDVLDFCSDTDFALRIGFGEVGEIRIPQEGSWESFSIRVAGRDTIDSSG